MFVLRHFVIVIIRTFNGNGWCTSFKTCTVKCKDLCHIPIIILYKNMYLLFCLIDKDRLISSVIFFSFFYVFET